MDEKMYIIDIGKDFSQVLGHRYINEGPFSGELFYEKHLKPKFDLALKNKTHLTINLSNVLSLPPSFLSESFGKLSQEYGKRKVNKVLILKAVNKERFIDKVQIVIENPLTFNLQ